MKQDFAKLISHYSAFNMIKPTIQNIFFANSIACYGRGLYKKTITLHL